MGLPGATDPMDRPWTSGFFKHPVDGPVRLRTHGLDGDGQADLVHHGGPDKAALCYARVNYDRWRADGIGDFTFGGFGENLTLDGADETGTCLGDVFDLGDPSTGPRVQVSQPRQPCFKLGRRWRMKDLPLRVIETGRGGWYVRVLRQGVVRAGDLVLLIDRPRPRWTVDAMNRVLYAPADDTDAREAAIELANDPLLSEAWRSQMAARAQRA
jgi:MOSC domain-containing protein YiiM